MFIWNQKVGITTTTVFWIFTNKFIEHIWYIIILMCLYDWPYKRATDGSSLQKYDVITIILLLPLKALFFIHLFYINLCIHYVPQASRVLYWKHHEVNLLKYVYYLKCSTSPSHLLPSKSFVFLIFLFLRRKVFMWQWLRVRMFTLVFQYVHIIISYYITLYLLFGLISTVTNWVGP